MNKRVYICAPMETALDISNAAKFAQYVIACGAAPFAPHFYSMCADNGRVFPNKALAQMGKSFLWYCDEIWIFGARITRRMREEISFCKHLNIRTVSIPESKTVKILGG